MVIQPRVGLPTAQPTPHTRWPARLGWGVAVAFPIAFLLAFFLVPVVSLVAVGFEGGIVSAVTEVFASSRTFRVLRQTLAQASAGTLLSLTLGLPAAFVLYRLQFRGRTLLRGITAVPFVLPTVVVGISFVALFGPGSPLEWLGLDRSFTAIVLALAFFNVTVVARLVGGFWAQVDPRSEQAAQMLGSSPTRVLFTVTLPTLAPAIASAASLVFLFCATAFGVVLVLGGRAFSNIETEIYRLTVQFLDLQSAAVLSLVQFVIVALVLVISTRLRHRRERAAHQGFGVVRPVRPRWVHAPVILVFVATLLLLQVLPMVVLVARSFRDAQGNVSLVNYQHLLNPPDSSRLSVTVVDAVLLSLGFAVMATAIALTLGLLVSLVASRRPRSPALARGIALFDGVFMLPLGVSAVTLGFGLLLTMNQPLGFGVDLRSSAVLIPIAQALIALPLVVRTLLPALRAIDPRQRQSAAMLGAAPLRVIGTIDLKILVRPLGLALGFAFATSLGEFGASAFLVRPDLQTLPVLIGQLIGRPGAENYGMALAGAVVLAALTAAVMLVAERWRGEGVAEL